MPPPVAQYREFAPCETLRAHVSAYFSFAPPGGRQPASRPVMREVLFGENDSFCSPLFADGHVSVVFGFERSCASGGCWRTGNSKAGGVVIGAMSAVGTASPGERPEMLGVYFRAGRASAFLGMPACELTDRIVALEDVWGSHGAALPVELEARGVEASRIELMESALLARLGQAHARGNPLNVPGLAECLLRRRGRLRVQRLADAAGVSRQHLTRAFRESVGVPPKLFGRLARFQAGLAYAGCGRKVDWAQAALALGYADQSHMIAEFREFSSLTPETLASQRWFHPFIERARAETAT